MAFIQKKSTSTPSASTQSQVVTSPKPQISNNSVSSKHRRTLAKQQQVSEGLARFAGELLSKTQEGVSAIEELKSAMEQIAAASEQNAGAAEQSLSAVNQITKTTQLTIEQAKDAIDKTSDVLKEIERASVNVTNTAKRLDERKKTSTELVDKSKDLKSASENIGEAVGIIAKVADQTNLLALNAAIEAARAKEHGKGFAVVAGETRGLAGIAGESAEATRDVVMTIQQAIEKAEVNITKVGEMVEESASLAQISVKGGSEVIQQGKTAISITEKLNEVFAKIMDEVEEMQKGSESIASSSEEQASAVNQATNAIDIQANILAQSEQTIQNLDNLAYELKNSTDLAKDSEEIASMAEELGNPVEGVLQSMVEIITSLEQIEEAAVLANDDAIRNTETGKNALELVEQSNESIEQIQIRVEDIRSKMETIADNLTKLSTIIGNSVEEGNVTTHESSNVEKGVKSVSKILRTIENIIIQTTMLAVSGNIEAARAGEFGKGFAVVSGDIRNLAQEAGANLDKINDILETLDAETNYIVFKWKDFIDTQAIETTQISVLTGEFKNLLKDVDEVIDALKSILVAGNENVEALNQALQGSEQIQAAADLVRSNASESKTAVKLIESTVADMNNLLEELAVLADELQ